MRQQSERKRASRDVSTYALLLRLAKRSTLDVGINMSAMDGPPNSPSGTQSTAKRFGGSPHGSKQEGDANREGQHPRQGTRTGLAEGLAMMPQTVNAQPPSTSSLSDTEWPVKRPEEHCHDDLFLQDDEVGVMPNTGAPDGLCGSVWADQQAQLCRQAGKPASQRLMQAPCSIQGVGNGVHTVHQEVELTAGLQDSSGNLYEERYIAPCLENSGVPGFMGIQSLERNNALIRCRTGEIWFLGRGGVRIKPSPGSRHFQMKKARSGHWFLPISKFSSSRVDSSGISLTTAAAAAPAASSSSSSSFS